MQQKSIGVITSTLTPWRCPNDINLWTSFGDVFRTFVRRFSKTLRTYNKQIFSITCNIFVKVRLKKIQQ